MDAIPFALLPETAAIDDDGEVTVGGVRLTDIAAEVGTPVFVYDEAHLRNRCDEAVAAFGPGVAYASKAFLCTAMARIADEAGMKIDVASGGEMHVALHAGVSPERLVFHGNNKSDAELAHALEVGVGTVVLDSFDEIDRVERIVAATGREPVRCLVRVTPGIEAHTHEYIMTGQEDSKFGFSLSIGLAQQAVDRARASAHIDYAGIHAHIGSLIFETDAFIRAVEILAPLVRSSEARELCVGGGLGVPYVTGEEAPSLAAWGKAVQDAVAQVELPADLVVTAEPGRSIAAAAGITLYMVGTIKEVPGVRTYLSVDGGMSDNPRPVLYGSGYEAFLPRDPLAERPRVVNIVGKHCESGDFVVKDAAIPAGTVVGDVIATPVTGAYGHTMASNYNRVTRPPVVFAKDGEFRVVVRRETYDDLVRLDI